VPPFLIVVFYAWLIIGGGYFIYRRMNGVPMRSSKDAVVEDHSAIFDKLRDNAPRPATTEFQTPGETAADSPVFGTPVQATDVAELVTGIALPCGLVPYIGQLVDDRIVSDRVVFSTTTSGMDTVVQGLQTELLRLGFSIAQPREDHIIATTDQGELDVRVAPPPPGGIHSRYPEVTAGAVVVELSTS
jgi:hypothetical protein